MLGLHLVLVTLHGWFTISIEQDDWNWWHYIQYYCSVHNKHYLIVRCIHQFSFNDHDYPRIVHMTRIRSPTPITLTSSLVFIPSLPLALIGSCHSTPKDFWSSPNDPKWNKVHNPNPNEPNYILQVQL